MTDKLKIIVSGGGTGGHIFPALSIANEIKDLLPDTEFLFVGAEGRMEMERVPVAGYDIVGLPIMGFPRKPSLKMFKFFVNLMKSNAKARKVVRDFKPNVAVGVGGYASGPVLRVASKMGIPTLIQEQNSYAGITNKLLAKKVRKVCVAYDNMDRFFSADKIIFTGNPVRKNLIEQKDNLKEAQEFYQLQEGKKVLLIVGGSLGARTLNDSMLAGIEKLKNSDVEVIWQTGKYYYKSVLEQTKNIDMPNVHIHEFLSRMDLAYAASDLVISRAGAGTISELCLMGKSAILVPSPNVSEDHQTKNAMALVDQQAAVLVTDKDSLEQLVDKALELINKEDELKSLEQNILNLARPNAANDIAKMVIELATEK